MKIRFFNVAKKESFKSDHPQHKIGCVVVKGNRVLSKATNKLKTTPKSNHPYFSLHAELNCFLKSNLNDLTNCDIYLYRENKNGEIACSKPCLYCFKLLKKLKVSSIYFTDYGKFSYIEGKE